MQADASRIIRTMREALGMSQAEFARALGWATSTISRWESGKAQPGRLALKIILAFGEERGIRYHPPTKALPAPIGTSSVARAPSRAAPAPIEVAASRSWTTPSGTERQGWHAELNFRVGVDRRARATGTSHRSWLGGAVAGAFVCLSVLGVTMLTATPSSLSRRVESAPARLDDAGRNQWLTASAPALDPAEDRAAARPARSKRKRRAARDAGEAPIAAAPPPVAETPPLLARLEAVTLLGGSRTAKFRTDRDSITVTVGSRLGGHETVRVSGEGVELRDAAGAVRTVRLGETVEIDAAKQP
jgi:transcriptional regulator with XRE-family HTH domain